MDTMEYKIVEGNKETFEKEINKLSKEGFIYFSNVSMVYIDKSSFYSVLMSRYMTTK